MDWISLFPQICSPLSREICSLHLSGSESMQELTIVFYEGTEKVSIIVVIPAFLLNAQGGVHSIFSSNFSPQLPYNKVGLRELSGTSTAKGPTHGFPQS